MSKMIITLTITMNTVIYVMALSRYIIKKPIINNTHYIRIIGGTYARPFQFPYQASVQSFGRHICGGSIISKKWIISAAHCFTNNNNAQNIKVRAGSIYAQYFGSVHDVDKIVTHANFSITKFGSVVHDIAVLRLKTPLPSLQGIKRIHLFNSNENYTYGTMGIVTGWGVTQENSRIVSPLLQYIKLPVLSKTACNNLLRRVGGLPVGQICAGFLLGGKDSCYGDSGGPYVINKKLAGIVSWGKGCARAQLPGAYTAIAFYRKWIKEHTGV